MKDISKYFENDPHFLIGVGLGPSNLALAIAMDELNALSDCLFIERQQNFGWHEAMKLPGADMQIAFMKDLVTPRNPTSKFSFLNYLKAKERLSQFINLRTFYPTRFEFNDYMKWVAEAFSDRTQYGVSLTSVAPIEFGSTQLLKVSGHSSDGEPFEAFARNVCIAAGHRPKIPNFAKSQAGDRVFHTSDFLNKIRKLQDIDHDRHDPQTFLVVGGGQSAAETAMYLAEHHPDAKVDWCYRGFALHPMDDSHFVNEVFMENTIDDWLKMPSHVRKKIRKDLHYANYSAIDANLIQEIYTTSYCRKLEGKAYLNLSNLTELVELDASPHNVRASMVSLTTNEVETNNYRAVVLATGYDVENTGHLWEGLEDYLELQSDGSPSVDHSYRVATKPHLSAKIYALGNNEATHGMGDSLLSNVAIKAGTVAEYILSNDPYLTQKAAKL